MRCVVSAFDKEIEPLVELFTAKSIAKERWIAEKDNVLLATVGVGYHEAAVQLNALLQENSEIKDVLFTGSAGIYADIDSINIGDACACKETILFDAAAESGSSAYALSLKSDPLNATLTWNRDLYHAKVATGLSMTKNDQLASKIATNRGVELENMELYGIARMCEERSIPWNAAIGVTNQVGSQGHIQWRNNFKEVARKCCHLVHNYLKDLG